MIRTRMASFCAPEAYFIIGTILSPISTARITLTVTMMLKLPNSSGPSARAAIMLNTSVTSAPASVPTATCEVLTKNL